MLLSQPWLGHSGVARRDVTLVTGARSRSKIVDVAGADPAVLERLLAR